MATAALTQGGIIAAGQGERLQTGGISLPKPLVPVAGRPLIGHAIDRLLAAGIERIVIIVSEAGVAAADWIKGAFPDPAIELIVRTTASSFESFCLVADRLAGARSVVTTVDGWFPEGGFDSFVRTAADLPEDAFGLGVTRHVDDEKPLWVTMPADGGRIERLGGPHGTHVTAGLYALPPAPPNLTPAAFARLRDYLTWLVRQETPVHGIVLPKVLDVDRPQDLHAAERTVAAMGELNQ